MDGVLKPYQAGKQRGSYYKQNKMNNSRDNVATYASGLMYPPPYQFALCSSFYYHQQNQLPPLLPLPSVSLSPSTTVKSRKNRTRKSKQMQEEEAYKKKPITAGLLTSPVVCTSPFRSTAIAGNGFGFGTESVDSASWVFDLSPPPSSLPVPKFCMRRSKLSCNAETN